MGLQWEIVCHAKEHQRPDIWRKVNAICKDAKTFLTAKPEADFKQRANWVYWFKAALFLGLLFNAGLSELPYFGKSL